jgi:hypothetical protein
MISLSRTTGRRSTVILAQPVGTPEFKPEEAYYTATQMGTS